MEVEVDVELHCPKCHRFIRTPYIVEIEPPERDE